MALKNAFENLALESTANTALVTQVTIDKENINAILTELRIMNFHLSVITGEKIRPRDLEE